MHASRWMLDGANGHEGDGVGRAGGDRVLDAQIQALANTCVHWLTGKHL